MYIVLNENNEIIEVIAVGIPSEEENTTAVELDGKTIDDDILDRITDYKYINGEFVLKDDADQQMLLKLKTVKIQNLSKVCNQIIENGIDYNNQHYSLTYADQINLSKLASQAVMYPAIPIFYHADGELCRQFTAEEMLELSQYAVAWVTWHTTYFNFAKAYINTLTSTDDVIDFLYGDTIDDAELNTNMQSILSLYPITFDITIQDNYNYDSILKPDKSIHDSIAIYDNTRPVIDTPDIPVIGDNGDDEGDDEYNEINDDEESEEYIEEDTKIEEPSNS